MECDWSHLIFDFTYSTVPIQHMDVSRSTRMNAPYPANRTTPLASRYFCKWRHTRLMSQRYVAIAFKFTSILFSVWDIYFWNCHVLKIEWKTKASSILIQYVLINLYIVILFYITDIQSSPTHSKLTDKHTEFHIYYWIINYHRGILVNTVGDMARWLVCPMKIYC